MAYTIERPDDMGADLKLVLLKEEDGDVIVQIMPRSHRFSEQAVEFCASGTKSPRTWDALQKLWFAMQLDADLEEPVPEVSAVSPTKAPVKTLQTDRNLENLPHMLRYWADNFEKNAMPGTTVIAMCLPADRDEAPTVYMVGEERGTHELIGLFTAMAHQQLLYLKNKT